MSLKIRIGEYMLESGRFFTAEMLADELGVTVKDAAVALKKVRYDTKYETIHRNKPSPKTKVISIAGRADTDRLIELWKLALFGNRLNQGNDNHGLCNNA